MMKVQISFPDPNRFVHTHHQGSHLYNQDSVFYQSISDVLILWLYGVRYIASKVLIHMIHIISGHKINLKNPQNLVFVTFFHFTANISQPLAHNVWTTCMVYQWNVSMKNIISIQFNEMIPSLIYSTEQWRQRILELTECTEHIY